jgi:hypothetical protein
MQQVSIPQRFNGPPGSGNGGYSAGLAAGFIDGCARVRLHSPPPLDTSLEVLPVDDGVDLHLGDTLVASARPDVLDIELPDSPGLEAARQARERFPGFERHLYPTCFVCGPGRPAGDGLELYTGPVREGGLYACPWQPSPDLLDEAGEVLPVFVWCALDCPSGFGAFGDQERPMLLGELTLEQYAPVPGREELVVYAWPLGSERRKFYGGAAVANAKGKVLAAARATWIAVD